MRDHPAPVLAAQPQREPQPGVRGLLQLLLRRAPQQRPDVRHLVTRGDVELDDLDLDTDLTAAAVVIEWGEGVAEQLSEQRLVVELERLPDDTREATMIAVGGTWATRIAALEV